MQPLKQRSRYNKSHEKNKCNCGNPAAGRVSSSGNGMSGKELNENNIAPAPILGGRGQEVSLAGDSWQGVAEARRKHR